MVRDQNRTRATSMGGEWCQHCASPVPEYQVGIFLVAPKAVVVRLIRRPHPQQEDLPRGLTSMLVISFLFELQRLCTTTATRNDFAKVLGLMIRYF